MTPSDRSLRVVGCLTILALALIAGLLIAGVRVATGVLKPTAATDKDGCAASPTDRTAGGVF